MVLSHFCTCLASRVSCSPLATFSVSNLSICCPYLLYFRSLIQKPIFLHLGLLPPISSQFWLSHPHCSLAHPLPLCNLVSHLLRSFSFMYLTRWRSCMSRNKTHLKLFDMSTILVSISQLSGVMFRKAGLPGWIKVEKVTQVVYHIHSLLLTIFSEALLSWLWRQPLTSITSSWILIHYYILCFFVSVRPPGCRLSTRECWKPVVHILMCFTCRTVTL